MEIKIGNQELPPLPFTYERTLDETKATDREWRVSPVTFVGSENKPRTDNELLERIRERREQKDWFISEYWRKKGQPNEQLEFEVGGKPITVYNFNQDKLFTDAHITRAQKVFEELGSRFPQILDKIRWILIEDIPHASAFGNPEKYPWNGSAKRDWLSFILLPRGMELIPHRIEKTSNFEGTLAHETTHLIADEFESEWREKFKWDYCIEHPDEWESRKTSDGTWLAFFNKSTGEMSPQWQFPLQPDECVNYYAKQNANEDICESMVAYIYDPELLQRISPEKFNILQKHDARQPKPEVSTARIPKDQIKLPEIKPEIVYYFIKEPES